VRREGRRKQGRLAAGGEPSRVRLGLLDLTLLVEVRGREPLVERQGVAGGLEDGAAVDDAERAVHP